MNHVVSVVSSLQIRFAFDTKSERWLAFAPWLSKPVEGEGYYDAYHAAIRARAELV